LGRVAHQHQAAAGGQGLQQGRHQRQIHHRHLVHHQQVKLQGAPAVAAELLAAALQQPVQGGAGCRQHSTGQRLRQAVAALLQGLAQPCRRLAGGRRQLQPQLGVPPQLGRQQLHHGAGLAGAGSAAEQQQAMAQGGQHRLLLLGIETGGGGLLLRVRQLLRLEWRW
jgi:hypothetical protein